MKLLRLIRLLTVAPLLALPVLGSDAAKPNIVIIVCDDLNDSVAGMGGHPQALTPNIDRVTQRGVRFTNAASNSPICGPSRASMWSGLHPVTTGVYGGDQQKNAWYKNPVIARSTTVFELFARQGYRNFATGKIHHNGHEKLSIFENPDGSPGFGSHPNFGPLPNDGKPANKRNGVLPPWWPAVHRNQGGWGDGFGPIQDLKQYGDEFGWTLFYSGQPWEFRDGHNRDPMPDEVHATEAVDFLEQNHDKPFLLTVGFSRPHSPWYAPKEYFDLFPLESVELAPILEGDTEDCARILIEDEDLSQPWGWKKFRKIQRDGGEEQLRKWTQAYLACVAFVDEQIGRILDAIEKREDAGNTIIIITSDHGYHMGEKDYLFKFSPWEESVRVPLIVAAPDGAMGQVCSTPVALMDIYPTCVDYAELEPAHKLDGFSFRGLVDNPATGRWDGPPVTVAASASKVPVVTDQPASPKDQHFSLRSERFRYIRCRNGEEELYDHDADPHEWNNLVSNPEYQPALMEMRSEFKSFLERMTGPSTR